MVFWFTGAAVKTVSSLGSIVRETFSAQPHRRLYITSSPFLPMIPAQPFSAWKPFTLGIFGYLTWRGAAWAGALHSIPRTILRQCGHQTANVSPGHPTVMGRLTYIRGRLLAEGKNSF